MAKKFLFYSLLIILIVICQAYVYPQFFVAGFFLIIWLSWGAREVYSFLIISLIIDLASSLPFGFFTSMSWLFFFSTLWVQKNIFRHWSFWSKWLWIMVGEGFFLFFFLWLSQSLFVGWWLRALLFSSLFVVLLLVFWEKIKPLLEQEGFLTREKKVQIEI
ncbi:hypothetical protein J7K05_02215 [bacterium]|nr:hypothetical protein [bacterium]